MSRSRSTRGVTLIEMLVVMAIISVSLAVVAPSARAGIDGMRARSSARQVAAMFAGARNLAIRTRQATLLTLDEQRRSIRVSQPGRDAVRELMLGEDVSIALAAVREEARSEGIHTFVFLPDGAVPETSLNIQAGRRGIRLTMDGLTGTLEASELE